MILRPSLLLVPAVAAAALASSIATAAPDKPAAPGAKEAPPRVVALAPSQAEAQRLSDAFVSVAERVSSSVVEIDVTAREDDQDQIARWLNGGGDSPVAHGTGSGVVITADGAIVTNNHVIEDALTITVHVRDGRVLPARLVGRDPETDLAVVKVDATGLVPAAFADSDAARVGEWVVAIGSPFGFKYTVTAGILSAKGRFNLGATHIEDFLQTDASINPGNSGGPLCDLDGKVVGINTLIVGGRNAGEHIGFAVPSNMARHVAEQLQKNGHVERAWIGVGVQDLTPDLAAALKLDPRAGALVNAVAEAGPGAHANLKPGDVIASMGGTAMHEAHDVTRTVLGHDPGQTLQLEIIRDGKHYGASVTLAARHEDPPPPVPVQQQGVPQVGLGLVVRDYVVPATATAGPPSPARAHPASATVITSITDGSAADRAGLKKGDVIVEADGKADPTAADVQQAAADGQLLLRFRRRQQEFYAVLHK